MKSSDSIKAMLQAAGYNSRQVSVRYHGSTFTLTIRDASVDYNVVDSIGMKHKHIHREEGTGEILLGGNTYIDVDITSSVRDAWAQKYLTHVTDAIKKLNADNYGQGIGDNDEFTIFYHSYPNILKVWDNRADMWMELNYMNDPIGIAIDLYICNEKHSSIDPVAADNEEYYAQS